jgi:hypothetical protein
MFRKKMGIDVLETFSVNGGVIDDIRLRIQLPALQPFFRTSWSFEYTIDIQRWSDTLIFVSIRMALVVMVFLTLVQVIIVTLRQY